MTTAYPLAWPQGFPRTLTRTTSKLRTSLPGAIGNLQSEMRLFGRDSGKAVSSIVVSSNVTLMDSRPADPGVACYFIWEGIQCCIAIDRYSKVEENLQAVSKIIEAERVKLRHGGLNIVRAGFRGFASLPPPDKDSGALAPPWREVLGVPKTAVLADAKAAYFRLMKTAHPDAGGDAAKFNRIADAWRAAQEELAA